MTEFPGEIDFGSSQHEVRLSKGLSYRESTVSNSLFTMKARTRQFSRTFFHTPFHSFLSFFPQVVQDLHQTKSMFHLSICPFFIQLLRYLQMALFTCQVKRSTALFCMTLDISHSGERTQSYNYVLVFLNSLRDLTKH